jgi:hypothetical protein
MAKKIDTKKILVQKALEKTATKMLKKMDRYDKLKQLIEKRKSA